MSRTPWIVMALVALLGSCTAREGAGETSGTPSRVAKAEVVLRGTGAPVRLSVEVADTEEERATGLMGRETLPPDAGMAFVWDAPVTTTFWMKDTPIPLSIAFWDAQGSIVALREMTPCAADPCPVYGADVPFVGAAEANAGFFTDHGIVVGDRVTLVRTDA